MRKYEIETKEFLSTLDLGDIFEYNTLVNYLLVDKNSQEYLFNEQKNISKTMSKLSGEGLISKISKGYDRNSTLTIWMKTK